MIDTKNGRKSLRYSKLKRLREKLEPRKTVKVKRMRRKRMTRRRTTKRRAVQFRVARNLKLLVAVTHSPRLVVLLAINWTRHLIDLDRLQPSLRLRSR